VYTKYTLYTVYTYYMGIHMSITRGTPMELGMALTERDRNILDMLAEVSILTTDQVGRLFFPSMYACRNRLIVLKRAEWVKEERPFQFYKNSRKLLKLGKRACEVLGYSMSRAYASTFVDHQLGINELMVQLTVSGILKKYGVSWQDGGKFTLPFENQSIRPDARLIHPKTEHKMYLEYDRGTKNLLTIADNLKNYLAYYDEQEIRSKGHGLIQVIYIVPNASRVASVQETFNMVCKKQGRSFAQSSIQFSLSAFTQDEFFKEVEHLLLGETVKTKPPTVVEEKPVEPVFLKHVPPNILEKLGGMKEKF
jgi:hypothetical protein